jgi:hypothetical protein
VLSIALAFLFGYSLTMTPVLRAGVAFRAAIGVALAADTLSIAVMELVDNGTIIVVPRIDERGTCRSTVLGATAGRVPHRLLCDCARQPADDFARTRLRGRPRIPPQSPMNWRPR